MRRGRVPPFPPKRRRPEKRRSSALDAKTLEKQTKLKGARSGEKNQVPGKGKTTTSVAPRASFLASPENSPNSRKTPLTCPEIHRRIPHVAPKCPQHDPRRSLVWPEFPFLFPLSAPVFPYNNTQKYLTAPTRLGVARERG